MLIIANGAPKSGSTWLFNIAQSIRSFDTVPEDYLLDPANPNSEIVYEKLPQFLQSVDFSQKDYLLKNHFGKADERDAILSTPLTRVLNIKRNMKDAVVSGYHHKMRESGEKLSFKTFYWKEGRYLGDHIRRYHQIWETDPSSRVLGLSYERLKTDPIAEIMGIARFMSVDLTEAEAEKVHDATSMENLRKKYSDDGDIKFFRKGVSGDWMNYFDDQMVKDFEMIENGGVQSLPLVPTIMAKARARIV